MSQAHKNRNAPWSGSTKQKNMLTAMAETRAYHDNKFKRMMAHEGRKAELDPKQNPSGKAKFEGKGSQWTGPENLTRIYKHGVEARPDPAASARGANVRANKARGTDSSAKRVPVK